MATMPPGNLIGGNLVTPDQPSILTVTEIAPNLIPSGSNLESMVSIVGMEGRVRDQRITVASFLDGWQGTTAGPKGGGDFVWDDDKPKSAHDGVRVISPTVPWNGSLSTLAAFLAGTGETDASGNGCWLRICDRIDPYMAGATGDGTTNDNAALIGWQNSLNRSPNGRAFGQILAGDYLSNGTSINIDVEYVDIYLDVGARLISSAASSKGHLFGIVGYASLNTETTPTRKFAKVWGPGRVDAWNAGPNENAIGFGRVDFVIVDGPITTAGNKGVTAQYGIGRAEFRNITIPFAAFRGVTVEDQGTAPDVLIENVKIGTTGDSGILAAGASVRLHDIRIDQAHTTSVAPDTGAVHVNSTATLLYAETIGISVNDAGSGKGLIFSGAQDGRIDDVNIGDSTGNAVELFNCGQIEVGSLHAPSSPNGVITTGTTPTPRRKAWDDNALASGEESIPRLQIGNTALSLTSGTMRLVYFTARKTETVTKVRIVCGGTAAGATPTLIRVGVYTVASNGDLTLVGSTANDTTLLAATNTVYTKTLQASLLKKAGQRYAIGLLVVSGTTMPSTIGQTGAGNITSEFAKTPQIAGSIASLADLPSPTQAAGGISAATATIYAALEP